MNSSFLREEREDGFSLVELLVVIVIIGILSAIAVGAFLNQRQKANLAALKSEMRQVVNTIETMKVDYPNSFGVTVADNTNLDYRTYELYTKPSGKLGKILTTEEVAKNDSDIIIVTTTPFQKEEYILAGVHTNGSNSNAEHFALTNNYLNFVSEIREKYDGDDSRATESERRKAEALLQEAMDTVGGQLSVVYDSSTGKMSEMTYLEAFTKR